MAVDFQAFFMAAAGSTPAALIGLGSWRATHKGNKILKGNGKGDVAQMVEGILEWEEAHETCHNKREIGCP